MAEPNILKPLRKFGDEKFKPFRDARGVSMPICKVYEALKHIKIKSLNFRIIKLLKKLLSLLCVFLCFRTQVHALSNTAQIEEIDVHHNLQNLGISAEQVVLVALSAVPNINAPAYLNLLQNSGLWPLIKYKLSQNKTQFPVQTLNILDQVLQKFWLRTGERWEINGKQFWLDYQAKINHEYQLLNISTPMINYKHIETALLSTGIYAEVAYKAPSIASKPEAILMLGTIYKNFDARLNYLLNLINKEPNKQWGALYLLCSRRPLDKIQEAKAIVAMQNAGYKVFDEYNMMRYNTQKARARNSKFKTIKTQYVIAENSIVNAKVHRATTQTTMDKFLELKTLETHFVAISAAPFIGYQAATIKRNLEFANLSKLKRFVQTIGPGCNAVAMSEISSNKEFAIIKPIVALDSFSRQIHENKLMLENNFGFKVKLRLLN